MTRVSLIYKVTILFAVALLFPFAAIAAKDCRVVEYPDHFEAICTGDQKLKTGQPEQGFAGQALASGAQVSKRRQRIEDIRSLNQHRMDTVENQANQDTSEKKNDGK
jgi:hypothetical protein